MPFARRIIIDTGILVSAAIRPESIPALALQKAFLTFEVCISDETFKEFETVLMRPKFDRYAPAAQRTEFLTGFQRHATSIQVTEQVTDCMDPKDNKFLALAETAGAELIVASDPHLTDLHPWRGIPIMPPAAFLVGIS
ncbi:putative toxin-antitoxin system toxin component, PIN family [Lamprobacter modestohalophilus]|uniref:Toxin-antitoxin system toxin component, PIN family n=1 Tax=Lamprobacter modestohalophilus TaxID=1064514 RepID=A0A9X0WC76_9GAMM|nr:putative toxin-antitoxin system toxin component, PIN family [Lamprobacter modestohalophilus]MBK1620283.1 putative toxin-antitoxin system toxin component, PIN family [Lamprobacter modestohalophilus]MCF7996922.1 putative toxin-antitoxin system toxin component, PIN family [Chromatiaceae bacterium]MCF8017160.1 putative toxin-antitoxin system toxin component, PIN family [Chromatiaceae bacterium]